MDLRFIRPKRGLTVPDHQKGGALPAEGREVRWDHRWARWLREDSIEVVEKKPKAKASGGKGKG